VAALFVLLATAALAVARYTRTPPVYVASQALAIVVAAPNSSTTLSSYDQGANAQQASQIAQLLTTPTFLTAHPVESDVVTRLQSLPGDATTRAATDAQIGQALSAQLGATGGQSATGDASDASGASGAGVTLTARWPTATGAQAVLAAASAALQLDGAPLVQGVIASSGASGAPAATAAAPGATATTSSGSAAISPPLGVGALIVAQALAAPTTATRDAATMAAARTRLYEQLALALAVALLLGGGLQWALVRRG
jgi:hypothetical protein